jgi:single-stranded-DNA-specific exonuclease
MAARLVDKYYRPAILVGSHNGVWRGSARSVDGFDVHELLSTCSDLFVAFGGHKAAAGFEILPENLPQLRERIQKEMDQRVLNFDFVPKLKLDAVLTADQISLNLASELETLAPFGLGNPEPLFLLSGVTIHAGRTMSSGAHLKLSCSLNGSRFEAMGFRMGHLLKMLDLPLTADLACHIERDSWNGTDSLLVKLADLRFPVLK